MPKSNTFGNPTQKAQFEEYEPAKSTQQQQSEEEDLNLKKIVP